MNIREMLFGSTSFTPPSMCSMSGTQGDNGGAGAGAGTQTVETPKDTSVLSDAKADADAGTGNEGEGNDADKGKPPADETPEAKATREAAEATAKTEKVAAALKSYDALKLPDGLAKDHPIAVEFFKDAAERGMSADDTQAMVARMGPKLVEAMNKPYDAWADMQKTWTDALPKDAEFGGKDYSQNLGIAASAMDGILGKDSAENKAFREMLAFTGVGNNPEMVRFLYRVGKAMKEGGPIGGKNKVTATPLAERMYPTMAQA